MMEQLRIAFQMYTTVRDTGYQKPQTAIQLNIYMILKNLYLKLILTEIKKHVMFMAIIY